MFLRINRNLTSFDRLRVLAAQELLAPLLARALFWAVLYMKFERTKDGQPLEDIFHWEKNFLCPERDLNPRPPDYRLGVITTTLSEQPCWLHG